VTAVCSSRPLCDADLSARHGGSITAYQSSEEMLKNRDIHVVDVCNYPNQHAAHVIAAAKAGKHIILEKPLTLDLESAGGWRPQSKMPA